MLYEIGKIKNIINSSKSDIPIAPLTFNIKEPTNNKTIISNFEKPKCVFLDITTKLKTNKVSVFHKFDKLRAPKKTRSS